MEVTYANSGLMSRFAGSMPSEELVSSSFDQLFEIDSSRFRMRDETAA
jgi:hypothetical protein